AARPGFRTLRNPMNASELYKAGRLQQAIEAQVQEVKQHPADQGKRLFLFELLAFAGELERAARQIDAVRYDDAERDTAVSAYRKLLEAEQARRRLSRDGLQPNSLVEPPAHVTQRLEAVNRLREDHMAEAVRLLEQANAASPVVSGKLNDK